MDSGLYHDLLRRRRSWESSDLSRFSDSTTNRSDWFNSRRLNFRRKQSPILYRNVVVRTERDLQLGYEQVQQPAMGKVDRFCHVYKSRAALADRNGSRRQLYVQRRE